MYNGVGEGYWHWRASIKGGMLLPSGALPDKKGQGQWGIFPQ